MYIKRFPDQYLCIDTMDYKQKLSVISFSCNLTTLYSWKTISQKCLKYVCTNVGNTKSIPIKSPRLLLMQQKLSN